MKQKMVETNIKDVNEDVLSKLLFSDGLEKLEGMLSGFNIFEAIGAVNRELRHSDFLAFLLEPTEKHGLSGQVLSYLFIHYFNKFDIENAPSLIDIGCYDYSDFTVYREWKNIDLFIVSERYKLILSIENKIWSEEHSDQLTKYQAIVESHYPDFNHFYAYLTPSGLSSEKNENWLPMSYSDVSTILKKSLLKIRTTSSGSVIFSIEQYLQMLERHIVEDSEISRLCKKIYKQHKHALDLVFEHKPDRSSQVNELLTSYINDHDKVLGTVNDHTTKSYIRFAPKQWDSLDFQKKGSGEWTNTKRVLLFEFKNTGDSINIMLIIGPGDSETRLKLYEHASSNKKLFNSIKTGKLFGKYKRIYSSSILSKRQASEDDDDEVLNNKIKKKLDDFFEKDYPNILSFITDSNLSSTI
jgi:hypothetical protein